MMDWGDGGGGDVGEVFLFLMGHANRSLEA